MLEEGVFTAADLMTRDVAVVRPETSLREAVGIMARRSISGLPVVDADGTLLGMVTEGDLVRWHEGYTTRQARWLDMLAEGHELAREFLEGMRSEQHKVRSVMTAGVTTVPEDMPAREIASLMHAKGIKRVPVVRDGRLVGIVARSDLVRALAAKLGTNGPELPPPSGSIDEALRRGREQAKT
ncbi:MAG: CBS domain-containing protein [Acetobacteraceae bacterium]